MMYGTVRRVVIASVVLFVALGAVAGPVSAAESDDRESIDGELLVADSAGGDDFLVGGPGTDFAVPGDLFVGGPGDDQLFVPGDLFYGGEGDDRLLPVEQFKSFPPGSEFGQGSGDRLGQGSGDRLS